MVLNKDVPFPPHYLTFTLMNFKHIWMRPTWILFAYYLQRLLNKIYEFCTSSNLEVNLAKHEIMIFGRNNRKLNQEAFYLDKDQIEITRE
jgi:hypothetical protein